jgi:hypothetical protein
MRRKPIIKTAARVASRVHPQTRPINVLLLPRYFDKSLLLLDPPLTCLCKLIKDLERRHKNPSVLPLPQRLTKQVLKLNEVALSTVSS